MVQANSADVVNDLLHYNVCKFCCMRYVNERNFDKYLDAENYIKDVLNKGGLAKEYTPPVKQMRPNPCSICLGLLHLSEDESFLERVAEQVQEAGFDSDDVSFSLTLPITILLRDHSVWLYISDKYAKYYSEKHLLPVLRKSASTVTIKEVWRYTTASKLAVKLNKTMQSSPAGGLFVNIQTEYDMDAEETKCLIDMFPEIFKNRSNQKRKFHGEILTRKSVENALPSVTMQYFKVYYPVPPRIPDGYIRCRNIECVRDSLFFAGRYNKYSRYLSQTPWLINGERRMASSVEEIIGNPITKMIGHSGIKFSSSGREDVDVRTLGRGRPFILEILNPRRTKFNADDIRKLENDINKSTKDVSVKDLQIVQKNDLAHIKLGEQCKTKTYNCYCVTKLTDADEIPEFKTKLTELETVKNVLIKQKTPIRVLHRRSLAVRPRTVFWLKADFHEREDDLAFFKLTLKVDAGTYVKEFIHGDFGRTKPNLSEILKREVDILALDVEEVALDWPPAVEYP